MKKQYIAACLALGMGTVANADVVFQNAASASTTGNQSGFDLGMDFNVACPMTVTSLGTFDNNLFAASNPGGSGSIAGSLGQYYYSSDEVFAIQVAIYNVATGLPVTPIALFNEAGAASYYAKGSSIFQTINAVTLPVGNYEIVASGYFNSATGGFQSGNTTLTVNPSFPTPVFDTLGGALTLGAANFTGSGGNGGLPISFPVNANPPPLETPATGPEFLAGTFEATCNCGVPDGGTTIGLLGLALTGIAGVSRKFKK
jgi:VPDSG-CTERM motif